MSRPLRALDTHIIFAVTVLSWVYPGPQSDHSAGRLCGPLCSGSARRVSWLWRQPGKPKATTPLLNKADPRTAQRSALLWPLPVLSQTYNLPHGQSRVTRREKLRKNPRGVVMVDIEKTKTQGVTWTEWKWHKIKVVIPGTEGAVV